MLFKFHYFLLVSGYCASSVLLGVFVYAYTDATPIEVGYLFMAMPFISIVSRPAISSAADRHGAHKKYLMRCVSIGAICHVPFVIIPFLGPEVYVTHARPCWYAIVAFKTMADVAMSGSMSIGDALAMNYARRLGVEFMVYRVWATISWMSMGLLIGQINEVSFLPKYTPAFMILVSTFTLDAFLLWLWPDEYFEMKPVDQINKEHVESGPQLGDHLKSLMPRHEVLARMRSKLKGLVCSAAKSEEEEISGDPVESSDSSKSKAQDSSTGKPKIDKVTQLRILALLFRRDPRVILYLIYFVSIGIMVSPLNFFFAGLAERCQDASCDFSQLAGLLQFSMAGAETLLFIYIKPMKKFFGRLSFCILAALVASIEFLFYSNYWYTMNPYFAVLANSCRGIYFGAGVVLMSDVAFMFANEVRFMLPELKSSGVISDLSDSYNEQLKLSLAATMQAVTSAANDGLGRGLGALATGILIEQYSYHALWVVLATLSISVVIISVVVKMFDRIFEPNLGLDVKAEIAQKQAIV